MISWDLIGFQFFVLFFFAIPDRTNSKKYFLYIDIGSSKENLNHEICFSDNYLSFISLSFFR